MEYKNILVTGGAGFVGSNISLNYKRDCPRSNVTVLDNLIRRGSELNVPRIEAAGIKFVRGDVRVAEDIKAAGEFDLLLECSAECSVLAGYDESPKYLIDTNFSGLINCLEAASEYHSDTVFLSTSRVYPMTALNDLEYREEVTRFSLAENQDVAGVSPLGIAEDFPLNGARSFYGASKLAAELIMEEYIAAGRVRGVINRCGVLSGPWQMGKVEQGFMALWVARHVLGGNLSYIGYGGSGKQVRDVLHVDDLYKLLEAELKDIDVHNGRVYNVGGGIANSVSLRELTAICEKVIGKTIKIDSVSKTRQADIRYYVSDNSKITGAAGWAPKICIERIVEDIYAWVKENRETLKGIL